MARARLTAIAGGAALAVAIVAGSGAAAADGRAGCVLDICDVEISQPTEDTVRVPPSAPVIPDADPSVSNTAADASVAQTYEAAGVPRCPFEGMRRDDEVDLAEGEVIRTCTEDEEPAEDEVEGPSYEEIVAYISSQYVTLPIAPSPISYQPEGDWALINMDFIVFTDTAPQTFDRELLGMDVTFVATPVHWSWDFGDGSPPLQTSSPGNPYPNQDLAHVYGTAHDGVTVSVTTQWQGTFQINGGPWLPVATQATTTAATDPIEIVAMDVNLVPNQG